LSLRKSNHQHVSAVFSSQLRQVLLTSRSQRTNINHAASVTKQSLSRILRSSTKLYCCDVWNPLFLN